LGLSPDFFVIGGFTNGINGIAAIPSIVQLIMLAFEVHVANGSYK